MAKKRTKNKVKKRLENEILQARKGFTEKEIKKLKPQERRKALSQIESADKKRIRRESNKAILQQYNLNGKYSIDGKEYTASRLLDLSPEKLKKLGQAERRKANRIRLEEEKKNALIDAGFNVDYVNKHKRTSWGSVNEIIFKGDRTIYEADAYLSVAWADVTGESDMTFTNDEWYSRSTREIIEKIHEIVEHMTSKGSKDFKGVPLIIITDNKRDMIIDRNFATMRGYNNKMVGEEQMLMYTNRWTLRGYASMMLSVLSRTSNDLKRKAYGDFKNYVRIYLPEIYQQIF